MKKMTNKKGFTLAELLIVVAIIAVLVAVSIPVFTAQLEKARESTDASNIRSAYAELMTKVLTEDTTAVDNGNYEISCTGTDNSRVYTATIPLGQTQAGWQNTNIENIGGKDVTQISPVVGESWTITYKVADDSLAMACGNGSGT